MMPTYPEHELWREITWLALQLHWSVDDLLDLTHRDRTRLIRTAAHLSAR